MTGVHIHHAGLTVTWSIDSLTAKWPWIRSLESGNTETRPNVTLQDVMVSEIKFVLSLAMSTRSSVIVYLRSRVAVDISATLASSLKPSMLRETRIAFPLAPAARTLAGSVTAAVLTWTR